MERAGLSLPLGIVSHGFYFLLCEVNLHFLFILTQNEKHFTLKLCHLHCIANERSCQAFSLNSTVAHTEKLWSIFEHD